MTKLFNILTSFILLPIILVTTFSVKGISQSIIVFAGADTSICQNSIILLSDLNASITGLVDDGFWFTTGDGFFDPGTSNNVQFSIGSTYLPGPNDIVTGSFSLILVSLDPDGNGPAPQVNDTVNINLTGSPALVCHGNLNVSLGDNCTEVVTAEMVLTNPIAPFNHYIITLTDENGNLIPDNILTVDELNSNVTFNVGHLCGNNSCWGTLVAQDKNPPILTCSNLLINCDEDMTPETIGFPVPNYTIVEKINDFSYNVKELDSCSDVLLTYTDSYQDMNCLNGLQERIIRKWIATDLSGNSAQCTQVISVLTKGLMDVVFPPNYNDNPTPSLECGDNWPQLPSGNPTPEYTGTPDIDGCKYLEMTYTDLEFELCGGSYKILREWLIVDWCTNETKEQNQVIKINDSTPPQFDIIDSLTFYTSIYDCFTNRKQIPLITNLVDCSDVDTFFQLRDTFNISYNHLIDIDNDTFYLDSLPVGQYKGSYIVKDACNNIDTGNIVITVLDNKAPFAICDQFTKISVITNGTARLFAASLDDNSVDNCEIDSFAVAKMVDICNGEPNIFKPHVDFCCEESGNPVMVALRVTDIYGNVNTCMAEVTVEDKELPLISCPSDLTINCEYDYTDLSVFGSISLDPNNVPPIYINDGYNNGVIGSYGLATDNCILNIDSTDLIDINCFEGFIERTFIAADLFGNTATCTQRVSVINLNPFTYNDIVWPDNIDIDGCDTSNIDIYLTKEPTYTNTACANVESTFEDQYFTNTNEACIKVLRTWTVIDWCTFDSNTGYGLYNYVQVIKLTNDIAPEFTYSCADTTFCMYSLDCSKENFNFNLIASDDCTSFNNLNFYWEVDENNDGSIEHSGSNNNIDILIPSGNHAVYAEVIDQCGNKKECNFFINAKDCKNPTPYCVSNLSTVIMPSSKELTITAKSFDFDSYDNCTASENLKFSFSEDFNDSTKIITCSDIENGVADVIMISMYVTDEAGNYDFCSVELAIQDNDDVCEDLGSFSSITGNIASFNAKNIKKAEVRLISEVDLYNQSKLTDSLGNFTFSDLPTTLPYEIKVNYEGEADLGLSTLDLVILQRHILGIAPLTSPYKILAGDANGSNKLNVSDLVAIRKVLLGVTDSFGPNVNNWEFVNTSFTFEDTNSPWDYEESVFFDNLDNVNNQADFIAIKIGDVNGSVSNFNTDITENRNNQKRSININEVNNAHSFHFEQPLQIDGFQINLSFTSFSEITINPLIADNVHYNLSKENISIICYFEESKYFTSDENLFTISGENIIINSLSNLKPELYIDGEVYEIEINRHVLTNTEINQTQIINLKQVEDILLINYSGLEAVTGNISVYSINGQQVQSINYTGQREVKLTSLSPGMYIAILSTATSNQKLKFLIQ